MPADLRRVLNWFACGALGVTALWAADSFGQTLFNKVRGQVLENIGRLPNYTCVQTVNRAQYEVPSVGSGCAASMAAMARKDGRILRWHDRLRLDVTIGPESELYSWAGASKFETGSVSDLVSHGATGSGEFGAFLASVFGGAPDHFVYNGMTDLPMGRLATFGFNVPLARSHYEYSPGGKGKAFILAYHGSFYVEPDSADLRRLEVVADDFPRPETCRVDDSIEYERTEIGKSSFMLPSKSSMVLMDRDFTESENDAEFYSCREYVGESTITYDTDTNSATPEAVREAAIRELPKGTRLRVRIDPPIDTAIAAAGDPIVGIVDSAVKNKGETIVRVGDKLHGRILRLEQTLGNAPRWVVAIRFGTIERNGNEEKISLRPLDDGDRTPAIPLESGPGRRVPVPVVTFSTAERPEGGGIYAFSSGGNVLLDRNFQTSWETR